MWSRCNLSNGALVNQNLLQIILFFYLLHLRIMYNSKFWRNAQSNHWIYFFSEKDVRFLFHCVLWTLSRPKMSIFQYSKRFHWARNFYYPTSYANAFYKIRRNSIPRLFKMLCCEYLVRYIADQKFYIYFKLIYISTEFVMTVEFAFKRSSLIGLGKYEIH